MPQFLVVAHDGRDQDVSARRQAARPAHLDGVRALLDKDQIIVAGVILDDSGKVIGSTLYMDMPSRAAVDVWLEQEPYIRQRVWERVEVTPIRVAVRDGKIL